MLCQMNERPFTSYLTALSVLVLLTHSCTGQSQSVVATNGNDIILPCQLDPAVNASILTLEWARPDLNPRFVCVWRSGQELVDKKHESFKGRASLFPYELKHGNISLKLSKVKISDHGTYKCFIPALGKQSFVQLVVASDVASSPIISLAGIDKGGVTLKCESAGWHPKPELLWLDGKGNLLSAGPTETLRGPDGLYTVSSRITVKGRHSNNFTCRVQQININQSREAHIHIPVFSDDLCILSTSAVSIFTGLAVSLAICIVLISVGLFFVWRNKIIKTKGICCKSTKAEKNETEREEEKLMGEVVMTLELLGETDERDKYDKDNQAVAKGQQLEAEQHLNEGEAEVVPDENCRSEPAVNEVTTQEKELKIENKQSQRQENQAAAAQSSWFALFPWKFNKQHQDQDEHQKIEEAHLRKQLQELTEMNKQLESNIQAADMKWSETYEELKKAQSQLNTRREENTQLKRHIDTLRADEQRLIGENQFLKTLLDSKNKELDERKADVLYENQKPQEISTQTKKNKDRDQRSTKGCIVVDEVAKNGNYVQLKSLSTPTSLGGWKLNILINNKKNITYEFEKSFTLNAEKTVMLWKPGGRSPVESCYLMWKDLTAWKLGDQLQFTLFNQNGGTELESSFSTKPL